MTKGMFDFVDRDEVDPSIWDSFVDQCDEAWLWHLYHPQEAKAARTGRQDLSFGVHQGTDLLAVVPLHLIRGRWLGLLPWSILEAGNPAIHNDLGAGQKQALREVIDEHLLGLAKINRALYVELSLPVLAPAFRGENSPRVNPLILRGYENRVSQTWVVDLRQGEDNLWKNLEKRSRNAIRKAEKNGVTIRVANGPDDLERYYQLHKETYMRTGVEKPHPREYFELIWEHFLGKGRAEIFFAEQGGEIIAAENFSVYKSAAVYHTGASNQLGLQLNANSALQWHAMQWMISNGVEWYETGEAFPNAVGKRGQLSKFKRGFGGELFPLFRGRKLVSSAAVSLLHHTKLLG